MKTFLSAGDVLINPAQLAFASVETDSEGVQLRLRFTGTRGDGSGTEILLQGLEARSVLRWLRSNSEFLDAGRPGRSLDSTVAAVGQKRERESFCCLTPELISAAS